MEFNSFVFPSLKPSYTADEYKGELIWIPYKDRFTYKDKLKYNNYKTFIPKEGTKSCPSLTKSKKVKLLNSNRYKYSITQKVPSISFEFENKFTEESEKERETFIPCIFIKSVGPNSHKIMIYFHANYEDLGVTYKFCMDLSISLNINVLAVEYPGYGVYKSINSCNSDKIIKDSEAIYTFLTEMMNIPEKNIIIMGRCLGSGPATYLASKYKPQNLILLSAFKSIKAAAKSIFDKIKIGWVVEKLVKDRFKNSDLIKLVKCPTLFIHGKLDEVIPWQHSFDLIGNCKCPAKLVSPDVMKHNLFNVHDDIVVHIQQFIKLFCDDINDDDTDCEDFDKHLIKVIHFPLFMYYNPSEV